MEAEINVKQIGEKILRDPILLQLSTLSKEKDIPLFLVGGYLRDLFLRIDRKDYDFALPKEASSSISMIEEVLRHHFFKIGKEEKDTLTYRIIKNELSIDLTLFQGQAIENDLQRRDFTINAMAFSLRDGTFHEVEGASEDIEKRVIRAVSGHSIDQDPLRMLRAIRYICTLQGFLMNKTLKEEIIRKKELIRKLPGERIRMELDRILLSPLPSIGLKSLSELGLLFILFPELKGLERLGQNEHHHLHVLSHTLLMIDKISWAADWITSNGKEISFTQEDWLSLYYAALLHDVGKQDTYTKNENGKIHFYHHESFSCQAADRIMERLRFSNATRNKILRLIQNHMRILNLSRETKENALKRLVNQIGDETPLLVLHTLADKEASRGILSVQIDEVVEDHCLHILDLFKRKEIVHPPPLITGQDVLTLGYSPGPEVGQILNFIRSKQIDGEIQNREEALKILKDQFGKGDAEGRQRLKF